MLPVVVYKDSFSVKETECSVCLGDYHADDRLHRIPQCGHSFHVDCIDHWLAANSTCPLCRISLFKGIEAVAGSQNFEGQESINGASQGQPMEMEDGREIGLQERERNYDHETSADEIPRELEDMGYAERGSLMI